jgi:hypothetical protein
MNRAPGGKHPRDRRAPASVSVSARPLAGAAVSVLCDPRFPHMERTLPFRAVTQAPVLRPMAHSEQPDSVGCQPCAGSFDVKSTIEKQQKQYDALCLSGRMFSRWERPCCTRRHVARRTPRLFLYTLSAPGRINTKKSRGTMHGDGAGGRAGQLWYNAGMIQRGGSDGRTYNPKKEAERERERERERR